MNRFLQLALAVAILGACSALPRKRRQASPCASMPCYMGGTCVDAGAAYTCTCPQYYQGTRCEVVCGEADIYMVLDESGSITKANWDNAVIPFTHAVADGLPVDEGLAKVGLMKFATKCTLEWDLNKYPDKNNLLNKIDGLNYDQGSTNTSGCLWRSHYEGFTAPLGDRPYTKNLLIFFTDGESNLDQPRVLPEADFVHNVGTEVIVIATGDPSVHNDTELSAIASDPDSQYLFKVNDFNAMAAIADQIVQATCQVNECLSSPCMNGATCVDVFGFYFCICPAGFSGQNCDQNLDDCVSAPCQNGGTCVDGIVRWSCTCPIGFTGITCQTLIDNCKSNPCMNGATCVNSPAAYACTCPPGYMGLRCDVDVDECLSLPCMNGATCNNMVASYTCTCAPGFTGPQCQSDIDECASSPCMNGGTCLNQGAKYLCACANGFMGVNCQTDIDDCAPKPCLNGGTCKDGPNSYTCSCPAGFTGSQCQTNINECQPNPCQNGGVCVDGINSYTCQCPPGFTGVICQQDVNECLSSPCVFGTCTNGLNMYSCTCLAGYMGLNCDQNIDECASKPCLNGGTCMDQNNGYQCACATGFMGLNCQTNINDCGPTSCLNGGTCIDGINSFTCVCPAGFTGMNCQTNINECASQPCLNGGTCVDMINRYSCTCPPNFNGSVCEIDAKNCEKIDVCFILDSSASLKKAGWSNVLNFAVSFSSSIKIGVNAGRVGIVSFSNDAALSIPMNRYYTKTDLITGITYVPFMERSTYSNLGLDLAFSDCFNQLNGERPGIRNIAIFVTDGQSADPVATANSGGLLRTKAEVWAVGVGAAMNNSAELVAVAGDASRVKTAPTPAELDSLVITLLQGTCGIDKLDCSGMPCLNGGICNNSPTAGYTCSCINNYTGKDCEIPPKTCAQADVIFILDSSASIRPNNWTIVLNFVSDIVMNLPVGQGAVHVGVVVYSEVVDIPIMLGTIHDKATLISLIKSIAYMDRGTQTHKGIQTTETMVLHTAYDRPTVPNKVILITDGNSADPAATVAESGLMQDNGAELHVVGFGAITVGANADELNSIVRFQYSRLHLATDAAALLTILSNLVKGLCGNNAVVVMNPCSSMPCFYGGTCTGIGSSSYTCACPPNYSGTRCEIAPIGCANSPCANGGSCTMQGSSYTCQCTPGWNGVNCNQNINECLDPNNCLNGGLCVDNQGSYVCYCMSGFSGPKCSIKNDPCIPNNCYEGTCSNVNGAAFCNCRPGWIGTICNIPDPCVGINCGNGMCVLDANNNPSCSCNAGFQGTYCDQPATVDRCNPTPCKNGGLCIDQGNPQVLCLCQNENYGDYCELPDAAADPCQTSANPCTANQLCYYNGMFNCLE